MGKRGAGSGPRRLQVARESATMSAMPPARVITVKLTAAQAEALDAFCAAQGRDRSEVIRTGTFAEIGQPELAATMPGVGRPKSTPEPEPAPKKRAKKPAR